MTEREELNRIWETQEKELENIAINPGEYLKDAGYDEDSDEDALDVFLREGILEIKREQSLQDRGWVTNSYTIVTGTGGPHVEFDTGYHINVYWSDKMEATTYNDNARATIDRIEDYLKELYPE